jgi:hypothetical protein
MPSACGTGLCALRGDRRGDGPVRARRGKSGACRSVAGVLGFSAWLVVAPRKWLWASVPVFAPWCRVDEHHPTAAAPRRRHGLSPLADPAGDHHLGLYRGWRVVAVFVHVAPRWFSAAGRPTRQRGGLVTGSTRSCRPPARRTTHCRPPQNSMVQGWLASCRPCPGWPFRLRTAAGTRSHRMPPRPRLRRCRHATADSTAKPISSQQ